MRQGSIHANSISDCNKFTTKAFSTPKSGIPDYVTGHARASFTLGDTPRRTGSS